jgi:hypothetical protein
VQQVCLESKVLVALIGQLNESSTSFGDDQSRESHHVLPSVNRRPLTAVFNQIQGNRFQIIYEILFCSFSHFCPDEIKICKCGTSDIKHRLNTHVCLTWRFHQSYNIWPGHVTSCYRRMHVSARLITCLLQREPPHWTRRQKLMFSTFRLNVMNGRFPNNWRWRDVTQSRNLQLADKDRNFFRSKILCLSIKGSFYYLMCADKIEKFFTE